MPHYYDPEPPRKEIDYQAEYERAVARIGLLERRLADRRVADLEAKLSDARRWYRAERRCTLTPWDDAAGSGEIDAAWEQRLAKQEGKLCWSCGHKLGSQVGCVGCSGMVEAEPESDQTANVLQQVVQAMGGDGCGPVSAATGR